MTKRKFRITVEVVIEADHGGPFRSPVHHHKRILGGIVSDLESDLNRKGVTRYKLATPGIKVERLKTEKN